jgi:hypothetical protein
MPARLLHDRRMSDLASRSLARSGITISVIWSVPNLPTRGYMAWSAHLIRHLSLSDSRRLLAVDEGGVSLKVARSASVGSCVSDSETPDDPASARP